MATLKRKSSHPCCVAVLAAVVVLITGPLPAQTPIDDAQQQWQQLNAEVMEAYQGGEYAKGLRQGYSAAGLQHAAR